MHNTFPLHQPQDSATYALERDAAIVSLLDTHPVTAAMLVGRGWFPNKKKALARLRLLTRRKQVDRVGVVWRKAGRPEYVFCRWRPKGDQLRHEVEVTEVCLQLSAAYVLRGPAVADQVVRPDAEVRINRELFYLELDRGTMRMGQIEGRFAKYEGCRHLSLWVCADEKRLGEMRHRAEKLRSSALFTTFAEALADPHAEIWQDFAGGRAALPREGRAVAAGHGLALPQGEPGVVPSWISVGGTE